MKLRHFFAVALVSLTLASCGKSESQVKERPLSADEASQLAGIQVMNYEKKGAVFELNTAFTSTGDSLYMSGSVDWVHHVGYAKVSAKGSESAITEVVWNDNAIIERLPRLDSVFASNKMPDAKFVARPLDTEHRQIDRAVSVLLTLAASQAENSILIQQKQGSAYVRTDMWRETPVEVLRYGKNNRFWVETGTSVLRRFDGNSTAGNAPTVIDFISFGQQTVPIPKEKFIVSYDKVKDIYDAFRAK